MDDAPLHLADDFATPARAEWLEQVTKTLEGADFDAKLLRRTADGLTIQPLYTAADSPGVAAPVRLHAGETPWLVRCLAAHPDPARANADILADLEGGAGSALVKIDPAGADGLAVGSADALAGVLSKVVLELAPVALDAGFLGVIAADWLAAAAKSSPSALLCFDMDPLGALAREGVSPGPIEAHLIAAANAGARLAEIYPKASLFAASGRVVHEAGGGEADELGFALASATAYAKALVRQGLPMAEAFSRITLSLSADADYFLTIAKLRAARAMWARVTAACGAEQPARIEARSSGRMLTRLDPWTNMLRLTSACFGAAVGGADAIVLGTFTDALGSPTAFARRQSRNTQLVLMDEANLGRVCDPARGTWYVEALTDELARAGWAAFQAIEAEGGAVGALTSGRLAAKTAETLEARRAAIRDNKAKILGVTVYAKPDEAPVEVETPAAKAAAAPSPRLPGPDTKASALKPQRLAEPFEAAASQPRKEPA